ncbi:hypothetical protein V496_01263 [Pseudogymnoascus sp. VKM F-4515 (FW-2607)]|nr:hypothetical protein V496_01263 [Pseudogymnoascus sp. VKM F-4515 (FW-2607)]
MTNFLDLPGELRNRIYELCLLHKEPLALWTGFNQRRELSPGLLRASKAVHNEAISLFYAQNRFDFTIATPKRIALFLQTIGRKNAGHIQHLYVDFPKFSYQEPGDATLSDDSTSIFSSIQGSCANLSTLTAFVDSVLYIEFALYGLDNPETYRSDGVVKGTSDGAAVPRHHRAAVRLPYGKFEKPALTNNDRILLRAPGVSGGRVLRKAYENEGKAAILRMQFLTLKVLFLVS